MPEQLQFEGAEAFFEEAWTFNCKYYEQLNAIVKHPLQKSNLLKVACHDYFKAGITEKERLQRAAALYKANLEVFSARVRDGKQKDAASGRDRKSIDFRLRSLRKVSISSVGTIER